MKTLVSCVLAALLASVLPAHAADPKTEDEKVLYALGMAISQNLALFNLSEGELKMVEQGLEDGTLNKAKKVDLQAYITGCYGSLTTFNVLFRDREDGFAGSGGKEK